MERLHRCLVIEYTKNKYAERKVLAQALNSDFTSPFSNGTRHILRNKGSFLNKWAIHVVVNQAWKKSKNVNKCQLTQTQATCCDLVTS